MTYRLIVLLHVLGAVAFLGTFVAAWLVYARARRTQEPAALASLWGVITAGDRWLTPISVVMLVASGAFAAIHRGLSITGTGWIIWSLVALGLSGVVFITRLNGLQRRLEEAAGTDGFDWAKYRGMLASWAHWAAVGTAAVLVALGLMVLQPNLPGI